MLNKKENMISAGRGDGWPAPNSAIIDVICYYLPTILILCVPYPYVYNSADFIPALLYVLI